MNPRPLRNDSASDEDLGLSTDQPLRDPIVPRLLIREPGWEVRLKSGSEKMLCYMIAPGEDHYHRIADGEIYLSRGNLRVCLPCADRHGLLHYEPRALRPSVRGQVIESGDDATEYEVHDRDDRPLSEGAPDEHFFSTP